MAKRLYRLLNSLLSAIIALLGFSSCSNPNEEEILLMYGTPRGDFKVCGLVTNADGNPIDKAQIIVRKNYYGEGGYLYWTGDTLLTGKDGRYEGTVSTFSPKARIVCRDPEGNYLPDSTEVALDYKNGDKEWFVGTATATKNFMLKKHTGGENK